jgi:AcrR family transcriptional regulator
VAGEQASGTRTAVRRDRVRARLLEVAWDLCRENGLAALSLRQVAAQVGMRAPSVYTYFDSKHGIYDALFAQGQRELRAVVLAGEDVAAPGTRGALLAGARRFVAFCTADPTRFQLLFQRTVPGFEPSPASYALAEENLRELRDQLGESGVTDERHVDLWSAAISGLVSQQLANDPGGDRWSRLTADMVEMLCDHVGVPANQGTASG